jgi:multidrug efflux pump subunit AcrA (membrane-fusion protein)
VVNRQRGVVQVKVRILNPDDKLMPDMSCKVTFLAESSSPSQGLQVPKLAVVNEGESPVIFVLEGDVARRRKVTVGKTHDKLVEIESGVQAGEKVLLSLQPLVDGQSVHCRVQ